MVCYNHSIIDYKNMTIRNKKLLFGLIILIVIVFGAIIWFSIDSKPTATTSSSDKKTAKTGSDASNDVTYSPPTTEQKQDGEQTKLSNLNASAADSENASINISSIAVSGNSIVVTTSLVGAGWQTCALKLQNGDNSFVKSVPVIYQESFSTCAGFSLPRSSFSTNGTWTFTLSVTKSNGGIMSTVKTYSLE